MKQARIEVKDLSLQIDPYGGISIGLGAGSIISPTIVALVLAVMAGIVVVTWLLLQMILLV